jgi:DNA-binding MarR family transcriptional regulator
MGDGNQQSDPGAEAWHAMWQFFLRSRTRALAVGQEHELTPPQMHALRILEPGAKRTMREVADALFCDPSNVTGIVDRLEARGLIERQAAPHDRRAKLLAVTPEGERVRADIVRRLSQPPPGIAALSSADQLTLRDLMRKAAAAAEQQPVVRT